MFRVHRVEGKPNANRLPGVGGEVHPASHPLGPAELRSQFPLPPEVRSGSLLIQRVDGRAERRLIDSVPLAPATADLDLCRIAEDDVVHLAPLTIDEDRLCAGLAEIDRR